MNIAKLGISALCVFSLVSGCKTTNNSATLANGAAPTNAVAPSAAPSPSDLFGCYAAGGHTGSRSSRLAGTDRICINHTPDSRSGPYTFTFLNQGNPLVELGGSMANGPKPCPVGCYNFVGTTYDLISFVGGSAQNPQIKIIVQGKIDDFVLTRFAPLPSFLGCHKVLQHSGSRSARLAGASRVCAIHSPDSRSGSYSFQFFAGNNMILETSFNLSPTRLRSPDKLAFANSTGTLDIADLGFNRSHLEIKTSADNDSFVVERL